MFYENINCKIKKKYMTGKLNIKDFGVFSKEIKKEEENFQKRNLEIRFQINIVLYHCC